MPNRAFIRGHYVNVNRPHVFSYFEVQHDNRTDPPQGEEPHVKEQRHLEGQTGQNTPVCEKKNEHRGESCSCWV